MTNEGPPDEVKIRLKHGDWEVEITCFENKVKQVVENVLSGIDKGSANIQPLFSRIESLEREVLSIKNIAGYKTPALNGEDKLRSRPAKGGGMTCRGLLESLWMEGYFNQEKPLGEVHEEFARRGYNYDRTAVSHSLTDMVREGILTRQGTMRNYRYIQKRPFAENGVSSF